MTKQAAAKKAPTQTTQPAQQATPAEAPVITPAPVPAQPEAMPAKAEPAKAKKAPPAKTTPADTRKITVIAKENPHAEGSRRAKWFASLKTGMTVAEAVKTGVRAIYLRRMAAAGVVKLG